MDSYFFALPTGILFSFDKSQRETTNYTYFIRIEQSSTELLKLQRLDKVAKEISNGELGIEEAQDAIYSIISSKDSILYHPMLILFLHMVSPAIFIALVDGTLGEVFASCVCGLFIGIILWLFSNFALIVSIIPILSSVVGGGVAIILKYLLLDFDFISVTLVSLCTSFAFLPGLTIVVSITELNSKSIVSGVTRLVHALIGFLKLAFGFFIVSQFLKLFSVLYENEKNGIVREVSSIWLHVIFAILLSLVVALNYRVPINFYNYGWLIFCSIIVQIVIDYSKIYLGIEMASFFGSFIVGISSNLYHILTGEPPIVISCILLMLLVPGSISFNSVHAMIIEDTVAGAQFFFVALIVGTAIFFGMMISNIVIPIRQSISI
jgi:uncharacterized membrane protein YjjP (DUF1212 family)